MKNKAYSSFSEMLLRSDLPQDGAEERKLDLVALTCIFTELSADEVQRRIRHMDPEHQARVLKTFGLPALQDKGLSSERLSGALAEHLRALGHTNILKLIDLLSARAQEARSENRKLERLAAKYHPLDDQEKLEQLDERIASIKADIIEVEMSMMELENQDRQKSPAYIRSGNQREKLKQILNKLGKDRKFLEKKVPTKR